VAETPVRYCSNCGHELSPEDQFCSNCGQPVHRAAHVPTPDADVPVPPPPQAGGAGAAAPEQQPTQQAGWGRRHPILTGCLGVIGLFVLVIILAAALSGGGDETAGGGGGGGAGAGGNEQAQNQGQGQNQAQNQGQGQQQGQQEQAQEQSEPSFGDGTYQVGTDIQPGTYRTREGSPNCYWERLRDFTGGFNSIIANGNTNAPTIVTIKPTDAGFQSLDCGTWTKLE
jgi:zinc-ribbon domain